MNHHLLLKDFHSIKVLNKIPANFLLIDYCIVNNKILVNLNCTNLKKKCPEQLGTGVIFSNDCVLHKKNITNMFQIVSKFIFIELTLFFYIENLNGKSARYVA